MMLLTLSVSEGKCVDNACLQKIIKKEECKIALFLFAIEWSEPNLHLILFIFLLYGTSDSFYIRDILKISSCKNVDQ